MTRAATSDRFASGARIGDYRVEHELAIEATSVVYLAAHVVLPRYAYIKVTHPGSRDSAIQLLREACILEALSHIGIPRVHECGVLADRRPWCAIEMVTGATFKQLMGEGALALSDLVVVLRDIAEVLQHAHERGVVHRRLIPSAIVRTQRRRGSYSIYDWSDARTVDTDTEGVDPKDDIHALGALAFQALTGRSPEPSLSAAACCPTAPAELTSLLDHMLAEPALRPTASEVLARATWLCDTLAVVPLAAVPLIERPRWTPPQGYAAERVSVANVEEGRGGFGVRISRMRSS
jgi:serine/threonine protein kinase